MDELTLTANHTSGPHTTSDLRWLGVREFRAEPIGREYVNRRGRTVRETVGKDFVRTSAGVFELNDWYGAMLEAVKIEEKEELLDRIVSHCRSLAWLKKEENVLHYALECIASGAYLAWSEFEAETNNHF